MRIPGPDPGAPAVLRGGAFRPGGRPGWAARLSALAGPLLAAALAFAGPAPATDWPVEQYDPGAAERPADLILPMPCGGAMAFQKVVVPVEAADPLDDRRLRLGQSQPETGYSDYLRTEHLRGPFASDEATFYYIGRYEVTRAQQRALAFDCAPPGRMDRTAAAGLSWFDAVALSQRYSEWLLAEAPDALPPEAEGLAFLRLPTETEWEYAARGGAATDATQFASRRYFSEGQIADHAMAQGSARGEVLPVGLRRPNPLGLHDIYGNAEELMLEPFRLNAVGRPHGQAGGLVTRGGSVLSAPEELYSAQRREYPLYRAADGKALAGATFGLRLVLTRDVTSSDARLRAIRSRWLDLAEAPAGEASDPLVTLSALIEEEADPRRQSALTDLQLEFRLARDAAAAAFRESAKSTLLSGAVFIAALADGAREIDRQTGNVRAMVDQIRVSDGAQREALIAGAERVNRQLRMLRDLQHTYLLSYRSALETLSSEIEGEVVEAAFGLLQQELAASGQTGILSGLSALNEDLARFAARPDMVEAELLALALER
ncbi:formylglycine-generating enzyme family protein (plasmid) [Cereibacter azotoformans]|uniref:formylglycine-generating enzyme family protein n=1 Tax=Cereibacter azotoformans TaxID=43057 RepID=UPI000E35E4CB|nr:SUMF1/EgtB/PvdO family nonheme iron enzyme [Cereibacter azotoformans]AXQ95982.1 hypothetical protein D0Z66_19685 [Cereibacter sphaeroides]UIJ33051.1 formylglycine-generating enzyme family protein [Cereibacter azotoformans]